MEMANVRVMIADDYAALRTALARALRAEPEIEVVGEAADGYAAVRLAEKLRPDVVLMDINMPGLDGFEATRCIVQRDPNIKIIGLSMHCFGFYAQQMLEAGAHAYVLKDTDIGELIEVIEAVCRGETYVGSEVVGFGGRRPRERIPHRLSAVGST
jgi:DNA-binding NarL/FixJ family response regulator